MSRKQIWLLIFAITILAGFAARGPITSTLFEWYLKGYCRACLGSKLTYENLHYENHQWIVEHPVLTTKKRLEEGGYRFQADRAAVDASISWIGHSLNLSVYADNPHLDIGKGAEDIKNIIDQPSQTFHFFDVHSEFHVPKGTVFIHDFTQDHLVPVPLFFQINLACKEAREGCVALWFGEQKKEGEGITAKFSTVADCPQVCVNIVNVNCCSLQQALKGMGSGYEAWDIAKGTLEGNFTVFTPKNAANYAEGDLLMKDLAVRHKEVECGIEVPEAILRLKSDAHFSLSGILAHQGKQHQWIMEGQGIFVQEGLSNWSVDVNIAALSPPLVKDVDSHSDQSVNLQSDSLPSYDTNFHFSGSLKTRDGIFQKSILKGSIAGLKGEIELNGVSDAPFISLHFYGKADQFLTALPDCPCRGLEQQFMGQDFSVIAHADRIDHGLSFKGKVKIDGSSAHEDILFGFSLKSDSCILSDGWFTAEKLPLNKYLSPILFANGQMQLEGVGDFVGYFDTQKLVINYDAKDLILKNSDFAIEIKSLSEEGASSINALTATYTFDFNRKTSINTFPIRNATYFEKNTGLLFTEIHSTLEMKDAVANFQNLTAFCNGIYFAGTANIDWSMPGEGVFEVDLHANEMHGKISQLQHLLSHINKTLIFLQIPLEGNVLLNKEGGNLHFAFRKDGYDLSSHIQGALADGTIAEPNADLSLQELSMNFDYQHQGNRLEFTDIQGTLLVGKPHHVEEYVVAGDKVRFIDYTRNEVEFDVWVGDKKRDILRLAGRTRLENNETGQPSIHFHFNHALSHFGNVHPSVFHLAFKDWSQIELFNLSFEFELKTLLADLQRFSRTGLFFLSRGMLKNFNDIENAQGLLKANMNYDPSRSNFHFHINGTDVGMGAHHFKEFQLTGSKKGNLWSVDHMQLDSISLAFDVLKESSLWNINFLGLRLGDSVLIGLEGQYADEDAQLEARINLFEADLVHLNEWAWLLPSLSHQRNVQLADGNNPSLISGQLRVSGVLHAAFDKSLPGGINLNIDMGGSLNNPKIGNTIFEDIKNLSLSYDSSRGLKISNVRTALKSALTSTHHGLFLQEASYDTSNKEWIVDGLNFEIPAENLNILVQQLQSHFPDKLTPEVAEAIRTVKTTGTLQGAVHLSLSEPYSSFRLQLNDGLYRFMGTEHELRGFVIDYDPFALKVFTEYRHRHHRLRLDAHSSAEGFDSGEVTLSSLSEEGGELSANPLKIYWRIDPQTGYYIQKMSGELSGMTFDLAYDPSVPLSTDMLQLKGRLDLNFREAHHLLEDQIAARITSSEIGTGYALTGNWNVLKAESKPLSEKIFFQGELTGRDFELLGYRLSHLFAQVSYSPEVAYVRNLSASDSCGTIQMEQIDCLNKGNGIWQTSIPSLSVSEFKPSLLRNLKTSSQRIPKSLVIRSIKLKDINGILGDKNSFTGSGQLSFANPPKKNLQHTIFAIPAELLTRIGLDLAVLTPVRGTVLFDIRDGKAALTRFKDMYSKGRLSKFYLPNSEHHSYVDFDGNLNVQVRMKQYNLIFKLAELFTVTVQGTLTKPSYTLQKQPS